MSLPEYFADRVTAEIREQMAGVLALAERLSRQRLTPEAQACVAGVAEAAGSVRRTLDAALDLKAVARHGLSPRPEPVRLRDLADEIQARWQAPRVAAGALLLSYDGPPDACVSVDRARLLQVFDGLVGEALAGVRRGAVEAALRAERTPQGVRLQGRVRGARQPAWQDADLETRVREVADRFGLEVALGVMLARRIIDELGGALRAETDPGSATTAVFEIALPEAVEADAAPVPAAANPAHVLVVDDNATNRMVAQALCEMFDCTCEAAEDGVEAVEVAASGRFDLILMDIRMPRMDGVAATRAIRALGGPAGAVPIIALTANAEPEDAEAYLAAGMNDVVEKPMKAEHLLAALERVLAETGSAAA